MSEWNDLPNADLIDWVIGDVAVNHSDWDAAYSAAGVAAAQKVYGDAAYSAAGVAAAQKAYGDAAWRAACDAAQKVYGDAVWRAARDAAWDAAWEAARDASYNATWDAAGLATYALVAYDHAGNLFDIPVEQVQVLAHLGQPAAVLMLPACLVREKRRLCIND